MPAAIASGGIVKIVPRGHARSAPLRPITMPTSTDSRMASPSTSRRAGPWLTATRRAVRACVAMAIVEMMTSMPSSAPRAPNSSGVSTRAAIIVSRKAAPLPIIVAAPTNTSPLAKAARGVGVLTRPPY